MATEQPERIKVQKSGVVKYIIPADWEKHKKAGYVVVKETKKEATNKDK